MVSVKSWVGWDFLKSNTMYVKDSAKSAFEMPKATHEESFEEAQARLKLTDAELKDKQSGFLRIAIVIGVFGLLCLLYTFYLLWNLQIGAAFVALAVTGLCLANAARYHFWYFQVKNHKLGCTWREWLDAKISGDKK
jgi:intracellular multiplication protein IcmV